MPRHPTPHKIMGTRNEDGNRCSVPNAVPSDTSADRLDGTRNPVHGPNAGWGPVSP